MWKKVLVLAVLAFTYRVIECRKNNKDSSKSKNCRRTNAKAFRYCTKSCTSNKDCKENQKCLCDGDCGFSCVKNNLRCTQQPKGNNLKLGVSNGRFFGSVVTYSCTGPYRLRGSARRTCRATGEWDGKKAKCRIMCKDPGEITHGNRRVDGFQAGKTIQYWCFDAYTLEGSSRITCQNTGQWSSRKPVCTLPPCNPPPIPGTASVVYPRRMPKTFRFSDRVLLKCNYGYFKSGTGVLQCVGNTWRGGITCSPKSCGGPGTISNGKVIGYVYSFKEKVQYVCDEGYQLKGPAYRQCQANEKWSGEQPICEVVNCGPLNKPQHGDIIEQVDFTFGNRIVFECTETGRELNGSRVRICQSDGTWSGSSTTCELVKCNDPGTPMNGRQIVSKGYFFGGSVTFACDTNYTLQGKAGIICKVDKSWSGSVPQCLAPCSDPGFPYQGNRIGNDFHHDHTVTFTCPRYYLMEGVPAIRCSNGKWSDKIPICKAPCHEPAIPAHGWKWGRDFRHRHSVRFRCFGGYQIIGAVSITCNDGTWDSQVPVCKGICRRPNTPNNGRLHGNSFLDGDEVTFSCERNYDLFGDTTLRCVGRTWNAEVPECKARCRFIGRPEHGFYMKGMRRVGDMIKHGEQISYGCLGGYTMVGANMQECNNGRWTNNRPECKASCQPPGRIADGMKIGSDYGHGRTVRYQCNAEYTLDGREELVCNDGTWNLDPPTCKAPCPDPGAPVNGRMRKNANLRHNSFVHFECDDDYQLDGNALIRCVDGSWSDPVPKCIAVCPDPGAPVHGKRLNNDFRDGKLVAFECNHNYDLLGSKTITCNGGVWSGNTPQCKGRCTFDGKPENGYTLKQNLTGGVSIEHNNSVEYACNAPYSLTGSRVLHCDDGKWNASAPSCKASCVDPGHIANGIRNGNLFSHGQTVTYGCNEGYSLQGSHHLECNDGNWNSDLPQCKASCRQLQPPTNGTVIDNETTHGASVSFSCDDGFLLNGLRQLMCENGNWTGSSPTCEASCIDPGSIKNGIITGNYSYGSSISFKCISGYRLRGSLVLTCERGAWNGSFPECIHCGESLGMEDRKILDHSITSSDRSSSPRYARLNEQFAWCTTERAHLQIDLGKHYKLTAISTQGGTRLDRWVKRYRVVFYVGNIWTVYSESGSKKIIEGNKDASSVVKYSFKEPFVTRVVRIYPGNPHVCLRVELYGCGPNSDCILVGSLFWVLWGRQDDNSINYYQAYITKLNATHINFALAINTVQTRSYKRTDPVLIIDQVPEMKDLSINARVIAVFASNHKQWYRAGTVTGFWRSRYVSIRFNNGKQRNRVPLKEVRLVRQPRFCAGYI